MDFQKLLLNVGKALSKDEVRSLAFLCTDLLGQKPTSVASPGDLFILLTNQGHLSAEEPWLLTELLLIIKRRRLIRNLGLSQHPPTAIISPYRKLLYSLSEELVDDDLDKMKFLLLEKLPRRKLDKENTTLEIFLEMEHMDILSDTDLKLLEEIIVNVCPNLAKKFTQFNAASQTGHITQETGRPRSKSCPLDPNQAAQSHEWNPSMGAECQPLSESTFKSSLNASMDRLDQFQGGAACEALPHGLSSLNIEPGSCASSRVKCDAVASLPEENIPSSIKQMSPDTNTNTDLGTYTMTAKKRGFCLIINNYDFTKSQNLSNREGTQIDGECLDKVFVWLGFEVVKQMNCTSAEIRSAMQELRSRDHGEVDCFVCAILSHGKEGSVFGVDGVPVNIRELTEYFNGVNCSSLAEKPKLFFIQACQGSKAQVPVCVVADGVTESDAVADVESIPNDADFLLGMATVPAHVSYREKTNGSWYMQSLCQNLITMVPRGCDLVTILIKVNSDVSQKTTGYKKQMPQPSFTLRKKVVFPSPTSPPPPL